jgi:hypothetical protein
MFFSVESDLLFSPTRKQMHFVFETETGFEATIEKKSSGCHGGVVRWSSRLPLEQKTLGSNPARV